MPGHHRSHHSHHSKESVFIPPLDHHSHHSRHHTRGTIYNPHHSIPIGYPTLPIMIPVPLPVPLPSYMPNFEPRFMSIYQPRRYIINDNILRLNEVKKIGIIFINRKGILFIKDDSEVLTIPYGSKESDESDKNAIKRIFKENTEIEYDTELIIKEKMLPIRLRSTGELTRYYIIYSNQDIDSSRVTYKDYDTNFRSDKYPNFVRSLFRDLVDINDLRIKS